MGEGFKLPGIEFLCSSQELEILNHSSCARLLIKKLRVVISNPTGVLQAYVSSLRPVSCMGKCSPWSEWLVLMSQRAPQI